MTENTTAQDTGRIYPQGSTLAAPLTEVLQEYREDGAVRYLVRLPGKADAEWVEFPPGVGVVINLGQDPEPMDPPDPGDTLPEDPSTTTESEESK